MRARWARTCGAIAKDCPAQGAGRAARVAPPSRASIRLQRAERGVSIWGAAGAVLVIAAQRGVCVSGEFARVAWQFFT